jgi:hypothetical protein
VGHGVRAAGGAACVLAVGAACSALTGLDSFHEDPCFDAASCADGTSVDGTTPDASAVDGSHEGAVNDGALADARGDGLSPVEDGATDAAACPTAELACDGGCVANDVHNCGACGNDCTQLPGVLAAGIACGAGTCSYTCASGYTECTQGKGCALLSSDGKNCGSCGHDCQGGTCMTGACQPVVLAAGQSSPQGIAVDSKNVYWTNATDGTVSKCAIEGCNNNPTVLASGQAEPIRIRTDSSNVYWVDQGKTFDAGAVAKCSVDGCGQSPTTIAGGQSFPGDNLAIFGDAVYWASNSLDGTVSILSCPKEGCIGTPSIISWGQDTVLELAVNSTGVYWTTDFYVLTCFLVGCSNQTIDGGPGDKILAQPANGGVTIDSTNVYWTVPGDNGLVLSCPIAGCAQGTDGGLVINTIAMGQIWPWDIAVDATSVYWLNNGSSGVNNGSINKCPLSGCPPSADGGTNPTVLASGQSLPSALAIDTNAVYWTDQNAGTVMKVAK